MQTFSSRGFVFFIYIRSDVVYLLLEVFTQRNFVTDFFRQKLNFLVTQNAWKRITTTMADGAVCDNQSVLLQLKCPPEQFLIVVCHFVQKLQRTVICEDSNCVRIYINSKRSGS